jgi:polysaccharide biosynthesis/export protein
MLHSPLFRVLFMVAAFAFFAHANAQETGQEYRLRPGDIIKIQVFQNPDLTLDARLTESGNITMPLVGVIRIGGLTAAGAEQAIAKALRDGGFIQQPQVTINIQTMRGNLVSVLGQVNKPGRISLDTVNVRLTEVLALAGGISSNGADVVILTGTRNGKPYHREIEIPSIFLEQRHQDDVVVADGDSIYVHRAPSFYIYGEVNKPGSHRIERGMTVRQALALAGGPSQRGTERRLGLYRRGPGGELQTLNPDLSDMVRADDVYYVRESLF